MASTYKYMALCEVHKMGMLVFNVIFTAIHTPAGRCCLTHYHTDCVLCLCALFSFVRCPLVPAWPIPPSYTSSAFPVLPLFNSPKTSQPPNKALSLTCYIKYAPKLNASMYDLTCFIRVTCSSANHNCSVI